MLTLLVAYIATAVVFLVMDASFLSTVGPRLYRQEIGPMLAEKVRLAPALAFYLLYVAGLVFFCVRPGLSSGWTTALTSGVILGLVAYGAYDLTCYSVMRVWTLKVTLIDLVWGAFASGVASGISVLITTALLRRFGV